MLQPRRVNAPAPPTLELRGITKSFGSVEALRGVDFQVRHLKCPSCVNPGSPMPKFESLGDKRLHDLAVFLEASKGKQ